ncbi:hypothetical protein [Thermoplasma sp.]|uniref:hypothetical protein n=1 Tax=Thermoplasma sp. TaxID=1973142 RepID=UPI0012729849|nr:hypothetical protein [Thermoplasma sp.]KAA8922811.1 MAG: hypothetical protein F6Q11_03390 [Thermoplasma sp.]
MDDHVFPPSLDYLASIRVNVPNPVPERFWKMFPGYNEENRRYNYGGMFAREDGRWKMFINAFKTLKTDEVESIVDYINSYYTKIGLGKVVKHDTNALIRDISEISNASINKLASIPGLVMYPVISLGRDELIIVFEFVEEVLDLVTKLILDYVNLAPLPAEVIRLEKLESIDIPSFRLAVERKEINPSMVQVIRTTWTLSEEELQINSNGIFQNTMNFRMKYVASDTNSLIARVHNSDIRFNGKYEVYRSNRNGKIVQFNFESTWFHDFYYDIVRSIMGPIDYWGYSDGSGHLDNYFVIRKEDQIEFLKALGKYWSDEKRKTHNNRIMEILPLTDIVPEPPE